jgi:ribosome modulation factor
MNPFDRTIGNPVNRGYRQDGVDAFFAGVAHDENPFTEAVPHYWWSEGWIAGSLAEAMAVGEAAAHGDECPFTDPEHIMFWKKGWVLSHSLAVIPGKKNPAARPKNAQPGC